MELQIETLIHPIIREAAYQQFLNGHLRSAVLDSLIAVFDLIRERTGVYLDGSDLVGKVFSLSDPKLILSELDTESGKSDQKGFIQILQGAYQGIRNPKAHSLQSDLTIETAAQYLVFASLLARRIESATLGSFLRYDGVYINHKNYSVLRFFEDGGVANSELCSAPSISMSDIFSFFSKDNIAIWGILQGTYTRSNDSLTFSVKSTSEIVEYIGEIRGQTLYFHVCKNHRQTYEQFDLRLR